MTFSSTLIATIQVSPSQIGPKSLPMYTKPDGANDRVAVNYMGKMYYVRQGNSKDHTLQVLALISQLINANKSANEIPVTKAVQIVQ
jgi:hypothetical protein